MSKHFLLSAALAIATLIAGAPAAADSQRQRTRVDDGWRFALGHASDPAQDLGHGTRAFFLAKADDDPAAPDFGWNSWNKYACDIDETPARRQADAMAASGMNDAGYRYIVIGDRWQKSRDADGNIIAGHERFPGGITVAAHDAIMARIAAVL
ncbi:hypothetical protein [Pseudoxanthomonas wuyuanensis]|uniref:Alpha-galactosidase n=1 Tax=Pseudoxanthomonas wuyuanensis TaxID=1073196 RepID=A0A286DAV8_9GAMM|nr:hypothetical protein [Pseudoxanthomonas wuyuanensis]KAF1721824.1 hypothetical protein CSC75_06400 [Pseudoxanthomonas wuyuanensis]SOD55789.1 Alpha galactosidase A [Pseudoxanthomonas wuyuanensis]